MTTLPRRSALYMPAANARALEKGRSLQTDMLILDLEDSVAPGAKAEARETVSAAIRQGGYGNREVLLRLNGRGTDFWSDDLVALASCRPDAVLIPKVDGPEDVALVMEDLGQATDMEGTGLWLMIETPASIVNCGAIAAAAARFPQLHGFVIGTNDLIKDTGILPGPGRAHLLPWLMSAVAAAKAHGLSVLDGVYNDLSDDAGFAEEAAQGRGIGMTGKTLIHPRQIAPCNEAFSPTDDEIRGAQRIVEAFADGKAAEKGVISVDGKMVELLHLEMAKALLARAGK